MSRQLFIYWKIDSASADAAATAGKAMQSALVERHPGLRASFFRRTDAPGPLITLMEVYAAEGGVDAAMQAHIERVALERLKIFGPGARHVEVFTAL